MKRLLFAALLAATPALSHDFTAGALTIGHPMAFETPPTARSAAGYFTVTNDGDSPDALTGIRIEGMDASLHQSVEKDGVVTMTPVDRLEIPAGGSVTFEPGGYHVMFMGLAKPFEQGDEIDATLSFERAGPVDVTFIVESRRGGAKQQGDTGSMDHSEMQ